MQSERTKIFYYPHSGQDPQLMEMQARVYGLQLVYVADTAKHPRNVHGMTGEAVGCCVLMLSAWLFVLRLLTKPSNAVIALGLLALATSVHATSTTVRGVTINYVVSGAALSGTATGNFQNTGADSDQVFILNTVNADASVVVGGSITVYPYGSAFSYAYNPGDQFFVSEYGEVSGVLTVKGRTAGAISTAPSNKVTFQLPKNETGKPIVYSVMQNGEVVATKTVPAFADAADWNIDSVPTADPVTLIAQKSTSVFIGDPTAGSTEQLEPATVISTGNPSTSGTTLSGGNASQPAPIVTPPVAPTPDAPHVTAKTDSPDPAPVTHIAHPWATPSGTAGATAEDIQQQTNDIIDAYNTGMDVAKANSGAVVDAINAQKAADTDNTNGVIDAVNKVKDAVDTLRASVDKANDDSTAASPASVGLAPKPSEATSMIVVEGDVTTSASGKLPTAPTFSGMDSASTIPIVVHIPVPGKSDIVFERTIDFSQDPYHGPVSIFRGLMLVLVTFAFFMASFWVVRGAFTTTK